MTRNLHLERLVLKAYEHALAHKTLNQNVALTLCQTFVPGMPMPCDPHVQPRIDTVLHATLTTFTSLILHATPTKPMHHEHTFLVALSVRRIAPTM